MVNKTIDWLIIAEKKSQAAAIENGLFDKGKATGAFERGGRGGTNLSSVLPGTIVIVRAQGHLYEMEYPEVQNSKYKREADSVVEDDPFLGSQTQYKSDLERLSDFPVSLDLHHIKWTVRQNNAKYLARNIVNAINKSKHTIISTDFDAEGEMIAFNVLNVNNLVDHIDWSKMYRAKINSLTAGEIRKTFLLKNLLPYGDKNASATKSVMKLRAQGFARSIADYEYGLSFVYYGDIIKRQLGLSGQNKYGRLKNALLYEIARVERLHDDFKPSTSYRVDVKVGNVLLKGSHQAFATQSEAESFIKSLPSQGMINSVVKSRAVPSPQLFSRTELLVDMNRHNSQPAWGSILQQNYEKHLLLSYPRTGSQYINLSEFEQLVTLFKTPDVQKLLQDKIADLMKKYDKSETLNFGNMTARKRYVDSSKVESHYAIIPTSKVPTRQRLNALSENEQYMYLKDLYNTMAMFADDGIDDGEKVLLKIPNHEITFSVIRVQTKKMGWRLLVEGTVKNDPFLNLPDGQYSPHYVITPVPAKQQHLYTKPTLLTMLKRNNWGTEATREATINDLIKSRMIIPSKGGIRVHEEISPVVNTMRLNKWIDPEITTRWQKDLDHIRNMADAMQFVNATRESLFKLNIQMIDWYKAKVV